MSQDNVLLARSPFDSEDEKALGLRWDTVKDILFVKVDVLKQQKKPGKNKYEVFIDYLPAPSVTVKPQLSVRIALALHMKPYDPLGFIFPVRMIGNLLLRNTIQTLKKELKGPVPWDQVITGELLDKWLDYFNMLVAVNEVKFPRSYKPSNTNPNIKPTLVEFSDGNPDAFGSPAYGIWTLADGSRESRFIMSKAKLAPILHKGETQRNELCGAVLAGRLKDWICINSDTQWGDHKHILDSTITQAMIHRPSYGYNTFAGLRIGELQQKTNPDDWLHVESKENIADCLTRGAPPSFIMAGTIWQTGPKWLVLDQSEWPVTGVDARKNTEVEAEIEKFQVKSRSKVRKVVAMREVRSSQSGSFLESLEATIDIDLLCSRNSGLYKVLDVTAYIMRILFYSSLIKPSSVDYSKKESVYDRIPPVSASEQQDAFKLLIYLAQKNLKHMHRLIPATVSVKMHNYPITLDHVILGGRVKNFPKTFSRNTDIPIIPSGPFGHLIVQRYHDRYHKQVDTVVTHVRSDVWIIGIRKLASKIDRKCVKCLAYRKSLAEQSMGELPDHRFSEVYPAWTCVNLDLFGPVDIRDEVIKRGPRVCKKVWLLICVCTRTRGVYLDICTDYSTESVLHVVRRLMASKGDVKLIISDRGSNLISADKEIQAWREGWDEAELIRFGASRGLEWEFVMPSSQHQNGSAEVLIKYVKGIKSAYLKALGDTKLTYNETNTMMLEIANICNERPIGLKPNLDTDPEYLSPNSLFLGRCSDRICSGPFLGEGVKLEDARQLKTRFLLVQEITNNYWKIWMKLYFPSLLIRQKWHHTRRNLQVDDVCLLKDTNAVRGEWRLARVNNVYPDGQGIVRNVEVAVSSNSDGSSIYKPSRCTLLKRHVSNLIVLVPAGESDNND